MTRYTYDGRHFVTGIIDPRGVQPIRNIYDAGGRLVAVLDAKGNPTTFEHDHSPDALEASVGLRRHLRAFDIHQAFAVKRRQDQVVHAQEYPSHCRPRDAGYDES